MYVNVNDSVLAGWHAEPERTYPRNPSSIFAAPWYNPYQPKRDGRATVSHNRLIPPSVFRTLSPAGQAAAAEFASESEEEVVCEWHPRFAAQDQEQAAALLNGEEPLPKL
jgi:hypothetical protein